MSLPEKVLHPQQDTYADDFDAVYKWYTNQDKYKLTDVQKRQLERWRFAREWYTNFDPFNDIEVVRALMNHFSISQRQAYTDVKNSQRFFSTADQTNEDFEKVMLIERTKRLRKKAIASGSTKGLLIAAKCDATLVKIYGFDREKAQMPEPKIVQVTISSDPATIGALPIPNVEKHLKAFWKKKEQQELDEIEDVDYDEVMDNPRNERQHQKN